MFKKFLIIAALILISFMIGRLSAINAGENGVFKDEIRQYSDSEFSFINPLLECDLGQKYIAQDKPRPHESKIKQYIDSQKAKKNVSEVAVYYRDLNNGPWVGINEKDIFFPASLLKVPIAMFMYRQADEQEGFLDTKVVAPKVVYESKVEQHFKPEKSIVAGETYSYRDLLTYALKYSDNEAALILQEVSEGRHLESIFDDLHLDLNFSSGHEKGYMNVKDYAMFFRILYNTSYLSQKNSAEMLKTLSESAFTKGIRKHLPKDIVVANKFGEILLDNLGYTQLHDCGIVYYPSHPYIICVMTRGYDEDKLAEVIAGISKIVYEQIESQIE